MYFSGLVILPSGVSESDAEKFSEVFWSQIAPFNRFTYEKKGEEVPDSVNHDGCHPFLSGVIDDKILATIRAQTVGFYQVMEPSGVWHTNPELHTIAQPKFEGNIEEWVQKMDIVDKQNNSLWAEIVADIAERYRGCIAVICDFHV